MQQSSPYKHEPVQPTILDGSARIFLAKHDLAVLSTIGYDGWPHSAAVHYVFNGDHLYVLTKADTQKARDIETNNKVAVTIYDTASVETIQLIGLASVETDRALMQRIFVDLTRLRRYGIHVQAPPVTQTRQGDYVLIRIHPTRAHFRSYAA